jgi:hypothetical protein
MSVIDNSKSALENNIIFRAVIVAMFSIIMAISGIGATFFIGQLSSAHTKLNGICERVAVIEYKLAIPYRRNC